MGNRGETSEECKAVIEEMGKLLSEWNVTCVLLNVSEEIDPEVTDKAIRTVNLVSNVLTAVGNLDRKNGAAEARIDALELNNRELEKDIESKNFRILVEQRKREMHVRIVRKAWGKRTNELEDEKAELKDDNFNKVIEIERLQSALLAIKEKAEGGRATEADAA